MLNINNLDMNRLLESIDKSPILREQVFISYVDDAIKSMQRKHICTFFSNESDTLKLRFISGISYDFYGNFCDYVDMFESSINEFNRLHREIDQMLEDNYEQFRQLLFQMMDDIKRRCFILKDMTITFNPFDKTSIPHIGYIRYAGYNLPIKMEYIDLIDINKIKKLIMDISYQLYNENQRLVLSQLSNNVCSTKINDVIPLDDVRIHLGYIYNEIECNPNVIYNETYFNKIQLLINNLQQTKDDIKSINTIVKQFHLNTVPFTEYNLDEGTVGEYSSLYHWDEIRNIRQDIENRLNEFKHLKSSINNIENMKEFSTFNKKLRIYKCCEKIIDGNTYIIYKYSCNKKEGKIFFENGKRIGRARYHEVARITGMGGNKGITNRPKSDSTYWRHISFYPLTEEQIYKYEDKLDWSILPLYRPLYLDLIKKHYKDIDWPTLLSTRNIKYDWLTELAPLIGWDMISGFCHHEKFMLDNYQKLDINYLLRNKHVSFIKDILSLLS